MDFPVSWTPSMLLSEFLDSVGQMQPPIVALNQEHTTATSMAEHANSYMPYVPLNMSSSNEHEQEVRPITSNIGMHILPVGATREDEEVPNTNYLERETLSENYSIDLHSMERTKMISNGVAPSLVAQVSLPSAQSTVISMDPLMPVPALNQSSLPAGTQMGLSGLIMNQKSSNRLTVPDLSPSMTRVQQLGIDNNTTVNIPQSLPRVTPPSSKFSIIYEGDLFVRTESQPVLLTRIEGFRRERGSEVFSFNWPKELQIFRYFLYSHTSFRNCTEIANYVVFRAIRRNSFLQRMQEQSLCTVIELTWDMMMFLIVIDEVRLVGVVCPKDHNHQLERLLRGELHEQPNNQLQVMVQLLHQDSRLFQSQVQKPTGSGLGYSGRPNEGEYSWLYKQQQSQLQHVLEIQNRQQWHESLEDQQLRQEFVNQLQQQPLFAGPQWQRRVQQQWPGQLFQQQRDQTLNNHPKQQEIQQGLPEELQQQGQKQQQFPGLSIQQQHVQKLHNHPYQQESKKRLPEESLHQGQQRQLPGQSLQQQHNQALHNHLQEQQMQQRLEQQKRKRVSQEFQLQNLQQQCNLALHKNLQERQRHQRVSLLREGLQQQVQQQQFPGRSTQRQHGQALHNHPQQQERKQRLPEELQQQGQQQQQQQLTGLLLQQQCDQARHNHPQQKERQERLPEESQQQSQQQDQLHQEKPIISAERPLVISESEWFKRVMSFLGED